MGAHATIAAFALLAATVAGFGVEELTGYYDARDWGGACATGLELSPIDIETLWTTPGPQDGTWATDVAFPVVTGLKSKNTGHSLQLEWDGTEGDLATTVAITGDNITALFTSPETSEIRRVKIAPLQMHWHAPSEHTVDGLFVRSPPRWHPNNVSLSPYAAEGHIVCAIAQGEAPEWGCDTYWETGDAADLELSKCVAVFGVLYRLGSVTDPAVLSELINKEPLEAEESIHLVGTLDLNTMLPVSKDYVTYAGSLTTPDCNEGLRWHVFDDALTITPEDQQKLQQNLATTFIPGDPDKVEAGYRTNTQYVQPLNDRTVYHIGEGASDIAAIDATAPSAVVAPSTTTDSSG